MSQQSSTTPPGSAHAEHLAQVVRELSGTVAGPALADLLESFDLDAAGSFARVEYTAAAARLEAWAHSLVARGAAAVERDPSMRPAERQAHPERALGATTMTAETIAARLQTSRHAAQTLVREGVSYAGLLAETGQALASGRIDAPRAQVLVNRLWDLPSTITRAVQDDVLPRAGGRVPAQLRQDVEHAILRVDGENAAERHEQARAGRRVSRPRSQPDGMASLWVLLPAVTAVRVDELLDAAARTALAAGDTRTRDQLRADGLRDLLLPADADADAATATDDTGAGRPAPRPQVMVTMSLATLLAEDDAPADLTGYGPVDAVQARALALGGDLRRILTDPRSGTVLDVGRTRYRPPAALAEHVRRRDRTCLAPGCGIPADRADLDHTRDYGDGPTSADNLGTLCRRHHRLKSEAGFTLRQPRPGQFEWGDPTGHVYAVQPGTSAPTTHLTAAGPAAHPHDETDPGPSPS